MQCSGLVLLITSRCGRRKRFSRRWRDKVMVSWWAQHLYELQAYTSVTSSALYRFAFCPDPNPRVANSAGSAVQSAYAKLRWIVYWTLHCIIPGSGLPSCATFGLVVYYGMCRKVLVMPGTSCLNSRWCPKCSELSQSCQCVFHGAITVFSRCAAVLPCRMCQMGLGHRTSIPLGDIVSENEEEQDALQQTLALA